MNVGDAPFTVANLGGFIDDANSRPTRSAPPEYAKPITRGPGAKLGARCSLSHSNASRSRRPSAQRGARC
jgi:hypothetical protein